MTDFISSKKSQLESLYRVYAEAQDRMAQVEASLKLTARELGDYLIESGVQSLQTDFGMVKPYVKFRGEFKTDAMEQVLAYYAERGQDAPVSLSASYTAPCTKLADITAFRVAHNDASKLQVVTNAASFSKALKENPALQEHAAYVMSTGLKLGNKEVGK
jgi:hypothetical protein